MAERIQKTRTRTERQEEVAPTDDDIATAKAAGSTAIEAATQNDSEIDDILDSIDSILEENAEEFARDYLQRGGQ